MRKIIFLVFLLINLAAFGQEPPYNQMRSNYRFRGVRIDSLFMIPSFLDTSVANYIGLNSINGNLIRVDTTIYLRQNKWVRFGPGGILLNTGFGLTGGPISTTGTISADTGQLATIYDLLAKLNISDTGAMLSSYLQGIDTVSLSNRINLKLSLADTNAMLSPYLRKNDTASLSSRIDLKLSKSDSSLYQTKYRSDTSRTNIYNSISIKLSKSDSSLYYTKYRSDTSRSNIYSAISQRLKISDTASMLSPYLRKKDTASLSNRINLKVDSIKKSSDTIYFYKNGLKYFAYKDSSGGGGGSLTLQQVTDNGNTSTNDILLTNNADLYLDEYGAIILDNTSRVQEGYIDAGYGGNHGVALVCGLGYEFKWEGGMLFVMNSSGNQIREARYMFNYIPDSSRDYTKGYYVGSRWVLDNGDTYICTDNSLNAAVWVLQPNAFDSTSLSNRIDLKVDSINRSSDSVYYFRNGSQIFAYLDSVGSGQNGRFGNDTATVVMAKVHNDAGSQLTNGEVVYLAKSGTSSDAPSVKRAYNKADSVSANTFGFVHGTINNNDTGWVILSGKIEKLNTSAFANGDIIYLDSIAGKFTKSKPKAPYHLVYLGVVVKANAGNGSIFVKPQNGYELDEIHDVQINGVVNNQILVYSDTQKLWKNRSVYSVVDTSSLSIRIDQRVKYSDTISMLSPYLRKTDTSAMLSIYLKKSDTTTLSNRIDTKLNISDTSTMLSNYSKTTFVNTKLNISDTASMLSNYAKTSLVNTKVNISDTSAMLTNYAKTTLVNTKLNISDTSSMLSNYAKTNIVNAKLNISDTSNMLSSYLNKTDTASLSNRINLKLNISDTAAMLSNYFKTANFDNIYIKGMQLAGSTIKGSNLALPTYNLISQTTALTNSQMRLVLTYLPNAATITGIKFYTAGGTNNAGTFNGVALYKVRSGNDSVDLVASSLNDTTLFEPATSNSWVSKQFQTSGGANTTYSATAGLYYAAIICSYSSGTPSIGTGAAIANTGVVSNMDISPNKIAAIVNSQSSFGSKFALTQFTSSQSLSAIYIY